MAILQSRIVIKPRDFDRSVAFYERGLGLHRAREWGERRPRGVIYFIGGGYLELVDGSQPAAIAGCSLWLQVPSLPGMRRQIEAHGLVLADEPDDKPWGLRQMTVFDPDGLRIILVEVPGDHPMRRDFREIKLTDP
jgi:catechol 2,3-dioxygenase-like lactoylglutathione lyase family enzyme